MPWQRYLAQQQVSMKIHSFLVYLAPCQFWAATVEVHSLQ